MKRIFLLLFIFIASIAAQRRAPSAEIIQTTNPRTSRGRARFSQTTEFAALPQESETTTRSRTNRNQQRTRTIENRFSKTTTTTTTEADNIAKSYEVKETIDDVPPEFIPNRINPSPIGEITNDYNKVTPESTTTTTTTSTTTTTTERNVDKITEIRKTLPQVDTTNLRNDERVSRPSRISDRRNPVRSQNVPEVSTVTNRRRARNRNEVSSTTTPTITRVTRKGVRRRINENPTRSSLNPEISTELPKRSRTGRKITSPPTTAEAILQRNVNYNRRSQNRQNEQNNEIPVRRNSGTRRLNSRSRNLPPIIDENQLEVLPLFEREDEVPKGRNFVQNSVETVTKPRPRSGQQVIVKQSVIAEVNEVTSRRKVIRAPRKRLESTTIESNRNTTRTNRRRVVNEDNKIKENLTRSEEEITESDNYPEPFKMLIQAKKQNKEPQKATTRTAQSTTPIPLKFVKKKPTIPRRFPSTTTTLSTTSTTTATTTTRTTRKPTRYHAKINNLSYQKPESSTIPAILPRTQPTKRPRKLYSSKKIDEHVKRAPHSTQIPPSTITVNRNRYSSRYRKNTLSSGKRVGNTPPVYQPTVPTIRTTPAAKSMVQDKDLGLEVVTINDPIYTPPSANLVNDNYTNPDSDNNILVAEAQTKPTEKPKSLIEQIISSITAISTPPPPPSTATVLNVASAGLLTPESIRIETTRPTTILKLTPKKTDNIDDRRITTEKPTTVIEKILNSLSAIQLEATTENNYQTTIKQQVGNDFNTISPSVYPQLFGENLVQAPSTTVNNLDTITVEEMLQKDTIDSLLELLRSLSPTTATIPEILTTTVQPRIESTLGGLATTQAPPTTTTETNRQTQTTQLPETTNNLPPLIRFEVSPGSVSVFSANDLLNTITSDDFSTSTVTIPSRSNLQFGTSTAAFSTTTSLPEITTITPQSDTATLQSSTTIISSTDTTPADLGQNSLTEASPFTSEPVEIPTTTLSAIPESVFTTLAPNLSTTETPNLATTTAEIPATTTVTISSSEAVTGTSATPVPNPLSAITTAETSESSSEAVTGTPTTLVPNPLSAITTAETPESSSEAVTGTPTTLVPNPLSAITTAETPESSSEAVTGTPTTLVPNPLSAITTAEIPAATTVTISSSEAVTDTPRTLVPNPLSAVTTTENPAYTETASSAPDSIPTTTETVTVPTSSSEGITVTPTTLVPNPLSSETVSENDTQSIVTSEMSVTTVDTSVITTEVASTTEVSSELPNITASENTSQSIVNPLSNDIASVNNDFTNNNKSLQPINEIINNSVESSTLSTVSPDKDYYIFAVLNNNTILRKRPSAFPNKETPYLVVGVYPNNTIVRKFPNGTLVPMEPVIRVSGFDTRANPPTLTEITSNQVTPEQDGAPDNTNLQMDQATTRIMNEANPLSTIVTTSSTVAPLSTMPSTTLSTLNNNTEGTTVQNNKTDSIPILPTLNEILNGNTVKAFNNIINISELAAKSENLQSRSSATTTTAAPTSSTATTALPLPSPSTTSTTTTMEPTVTTQLFTSASIVAPTTTESLPTTTTTLPSTITTTTEPTITTTSSSTTTTALPTTTTTPVTTTTAPTTTTTVRTTTTAPPTTTTVRTTTTAPPTTTTIPTTTTAAPTIASANPLQIDNELSSTTTTAATTTTNPTTTTTTVATTAATIAATTAAPTTTLLAAIATTRTNPVKIGDNEISSTHSNSVVLTASAQSFTSPTASSTNSPKQLTKQQLEDLQTLAKLEAEQAAILKQLAFLNRLNLVNQPITTQSPTELANKIIALAVQRSNQKDKSTTVSSIDNQKVTPDIGRANLEALLSTVPKTTNIQSSFGKTNDAIIAELLKKQGIAPTTPNGLGVIYTKTTIVPSSTTLTTTTKRTTTTKQPAPTRAPVLMQGLRWLLNAFNGPPTTTTTQRPRTKSKPKQKSADRETLLNQPTRITPVVVTSPQSLPLSNSLSQTDVAFLIKKLEAIQKDPTNNQLDVETQKKLQNLITGGGLDRLTPLPSTTATATTTTTTERRAKQISTTNLPFVSTSSTTPQTIVVSNSILDDDIISVSPVATTATKRTTTTTKPRVALPPVQLNAVPGIQDDDTLVRGQLISAAINVTRALTQFLGSALQGAAQNFQNLIGSGSRYVGTFARGSSANASVNPS